MKIHPACRRHSNRIMRIHNEHRANKISGKVIKVSCTYLEHGVSSAKPFNAYNYARNVPRSMTASLEILPPAHTHTHTHRLVRNATNVRRFFVSADSVCTSKFTATTHATLSMD